MKQYCKACGHRCHCLGQGYYVSESICSSCNCKECNCIEKPLILKKPIIYRKYKTYIFCILIIMIVGLGLLSCTNKEKYPSKMDSIAKALSNIKK